MENIYKFIYKARVPFVVVVLSLTSILNYNIFGAPYGQVQRGGGFLCSPRACTWERSDTRCNDNSECCPGKRCSSFGYCELAC